MLARKIAVGFGIAIFLPFLVYYGLQIFMPHPEWQNYQIGAKEYRFATTELQRQKLEEKRERLQDKYQIDSKLFARQYFYVSAIVGLSSIIIGGMLSFATISSGLIFGGIFTAIGGFLGYWNVLPTWPQFVTLLTGLLILISLGYINHSKVS